VSSPEDEGLDRALVDALYCDALDEETLYGVLVVKNGHLVAEKYYNGGWIHQLASRASVTKSFVSAMVGIALAEGCLSSLDARMLDFFPEVAVTDPRKGQITLRQMLQMRSGYPREEDPGYWEEFLGGDYLGLMEDFPLVADPGTEHHYSNLTAVLVGKILARACETDLWTFGETHLFGPTDTAIGGWLQDSDGDWSGAGDLEVTARDMARFGQVYLDEGTYQGEQVVPAAWVRDSLTSYSDEPDFSTWGVYLYDWGYGYQWWSARAGTHPVDYAWGHGGNFIFLAEDLDLVLVVTADPFILRNDNGVWRHEKSHMRMAGQFLASLPQSTSTGARAAPRASCAAARRWAAR